MLAALRRAGSALPRHAPRRMRALQSRRRCLPAEPDLPPPTSASCSHVVQTEPARRLARPGQSLRLSLPAAGLPHSYYSGFPLCCGPPSPRTYRCASSSIPGRPAASTTPLHTTEGGGMGNDHAGSPPAPPPGRNSPECTIQCLAHLPTTSCS